MHADIQRDVLEYSLVNAYHWTPQEISKIPYKWLQKFCLINKLEQSASVAKNQAESVKKLIDIELIKQGGGKKGKRK